jgi:hypothetical protein
MQNMIGGFIQMASGSWIDRMQRSLNSCGMGNLMTDNTENDDLATGDYVYHSGYRLMRLRMLLTGTSGSSEENWSEAVGNLIYFLENSHEGKCFVADMRKGFAKPRT